MPKGSVQEVAGGDHGVHESVRERLVACAGREMIDEGHIPRDPVAVVASQQVSTDDVNASPVMLPDDRVEPAEIAGPPRQSTNDHNPVDDQSLDHFVGEECRRCPHSLCIPACPYYFFNCSHDRSLSP